MPNTVAKLARRRKTAQTVVIKQEHADYLGLYYPPNKRVEFATEIIGKRMSLVRVSFVQLFQKIRDAKGVEEETVENRTA